LKTSNKRISIEEKKMSSVHTFNLEAMNALYFRKPDDEPEHKFRNA
jgi:hypothetical protein